MVLYARLAGIFQSGPKLTGIAITRVPASVWLKKMLLVVNLLQLKANPPPSPPSLKHFGCMCKAYSYFETGML